LVKQRN